MAEVTIMRRQPGTIWFAAIRSSRTTSRLSKLFSREREQGQSLVEFALCLPIMLLIVTGITSFGITMNQYLMLTNATNSAARQLAFSHGLTTDPCALAANTVYGAAPFLKTSSLTFSFVFNGTTYNGASCSSTSTTTGAAGNLAQNSTAKIVVTYPCVLQVYNKNVLPGCVLTAQDSELVE
jgi:Flp pilus assembly protein TadG